MYAARFPFGCTSTTGARQRLGAITFWRSRAFPCDERGVELVVKTGVLPRELLELAWDEPERWSPADRLVVHWPGAPGLRDAVQVERLL